jgi:ABC-type antimicrobial peptide transport system permease subunit
MNRFKGRIFRSVLAVLGLVVGVASVMAMTTLGRIQEQKLYKEMQTMSVDTVMVVPKKISPIVFRPKITGIYKTLTPKDAMAIRERIPYVHAVTATEYKTVTAKMGAKTATTTMAGVDRSYFHIKRESIDQGRPLLQEDLIQHRKVCWVGQAVLGNIFDGQPFQAVGKVIYLNGIPFRIVGILGKKGIDASGNNRDDMVLIPLTTLLNIILNQTYVRVIYVQPDSASHVPPLKRDLQTLLLKRHGRRDFAIRVMTSYIERKLKTGRMIALSTTAVAAISLLVGGIGILAVMLINGRERIPEIGIKRAVGARKKDVFLEFLTESFLLGVLGGILGWTSGFILSHFLIFEQKTTIAFPWRISAGAFLFSLAIATLFGLYPAWRASRQDVIRALYDE